MEHPLGYNSRETKEESALSGQKNKRRLGVTWPKKRPDADLLLGALRDLQVCLSLGLGCGFLSELQSRLFRSPKERKFSVSDFTK